MLIMYQAILLLITIIFCIIIFFVCFNKHIEHLSYFTNTDFQLFDIKKYYKNYTVGHTSKKIITIRLKNVYMRYLNPIKLKFFLAMAMKINVKRLYIIHTDNDHSTIVFIITKQPNLNENNVHNAIVTLKTHIDNPNSYLMKEFYIDAITITNAYINDTNDNINWWDYIDPSTYLT